MLAVAIFMVAAVTACAPDEAEEATEPDEEDLYGGKMVVGSHHEISSLSPNDWGPWEHWVVVAQIHNALVEVNHNLEVEPVLAADYEVSDDGLVWTFDLHEGVEFHDGEEFTSEDVKYTFEWYWEDPVSGAAHLFRDMDRIETPDDYTVVFHFNEPDARFLRFTATIGIVPAHYHSEVGEEEYTTSPIGTGPFKLKEWRPDDYTLLEAFEDHFRGRPYLDEFESRVIPEASVRATAIETGEIDGSVWSLLTEDNLRYYEDPEYPTYRMVDIPLNLVALNHRLPQFSDPRVRQALLYGLDRETILQDLFQGTGKVATANMSPAVVEYYEPDVKEYPFDPDRAEELLDEAGWTVAEDGVRTKGDEQLEFSMHIVASAEGARTMAPAMQEYWNQIDVQMNIREDPWPTIQEQQLAGELDAAMFNWTHGGWDGEPDATAALHSEGATNYTGWGNDRVDELLEQGARVVDPEDRRPIYSEIQQIVAEEVPMLYLYYWDWFQIFGPRVQGLPDDAQVGPRIFREARQFWLDE